MDLTSYGINTTIVDQNSLNVREEHVSSASYSHGEFHFPSGKYHIERKLGEGTYGKIYEAVSAEGIYAIKVQKYNSVEEFQETVTEAIVNIILEKTSQSQTHGPYVQRFYEFAHDSVNKLVFMRMEMLDGTLSDLLYKHSIDENDILIPNVLLQIAHILEFFQKSLAMNHRDMKSDNIMYTVEDGKPIIKLIDLGLTCMTYSDIHFSKSTLFPKTHVCNRKSRDMSFLLVELLLDFPDRMSPQLYEMLNGLVTLDVRGTECRLDRFCPKEGFRTWVNSYEFLNRQNVENPHTRPNEIKKRVTQFIEKLKSNKAKKGIKANKTNKGIKQRFTVRRKKTKDVL